MGSREVCEQVAKEVMEEFGGQEGTIKFKEWVALMREISVQVQKNPTRKISERFEAEYQSGSPLEASHVISSERSIDNGFPEKPVKFSASLTPPRDTRCL